MAPCPRSATSVRRCALQLPFLIGRAAQIVAVPAPSRGDPRSMDAFVAENGRQVPSSTQSAGSGARSAPGNRALGLGQCAPFSGQTGTTARRPVAARKSRRSRCSARRSAGRRRSANSAGMSLDRRVVWNRVTGVVVGFGLWRPVEAEASLAAGPHGWAMRCRRPTIGPPRPGANTRFAAFTVIQWWDGVGVNGVGVNGVGVNGNGERE